MRSCEEIRTRVTELAAVRPDELPRRVREHVAGCPACGRALAAARLARGLVAAAEGPEPPSGFGARVLAALPAGPARRHADEDLWAPAWGLVPAFAATAAALLILFQASAVSSPVGLVPAEGLSAGERLVLEAGAPDPDLVLAAVMEGGGR